MVITADEWKFSILRRVELVLERIDSSDIQQAISSLDLDYDDDIGGVSRSLQKFKHTLISFEDTFLEAKDYSLMHRHVLHKWKGEIIRQVLFDARNMLDNIYSKWKQKQKQKQKHALINKVRHFFSSSSSPPHHGTSLLATQIYDITHLLQYLVSEISDAAHDVRYSYLDDVVIGREIDKELVIEKLLSMRQDDQTSLPILSIVGMEGLGKTTLANIVFRDKRIHESFSVSIWVIVSFTFSAVFDSEGEEVIYQIINPASSFDTNAYYRTTRSELKYRLKSLFNRKKFLLVLDDVRKKYSLEEDELRSLIQIGANGSKILLTTRSYSIASMMGTIASHNLQPLSPEDSLSLFEILATKAKAYKYPGLIEVGREIVNQCEGVPLAIKAIGKELFSLSWMVEWESMRNNDFRDLPKHYGIFRALQLSHDYMPFHLKQCFQLFSLYPNDFVFHSSEIISLWTSLDLLPSPNTDETLIDVSYQYLKKIIPRSFLKKFVNFGTSYYFQIHDVILDLARDIAKYECVIANSDNQDIPQSVQHLSFVIDDLINKSFTQKHADVRTILFPVEGVGVTSERLLNTCLSRWKYLRILNLSDSTYEVLPSSIGKLRYLRFLSLERNEKIKRVPASICKLLQLQVLNLIGCKELKALPKGLRNLVNLRQLGITTKESMLPEIDIANLDSLECLCIESCDNLKSLFLGIKLPSLKTLEVTNCGNLKYLPLDIDHFPQLETLLIDNCDNLELIERHGNQSSNLQLKAIRLHSQPQLLSLPLWLQYSTNTLQSLSIVDCKNFKVLPEWLSTFSVLGSFCIVNCPGLMFLSNDIHCLVALEYLRIEDCPELCRKCQPHDGEYWSKISHIKQIFIGKPEEEKKQ